MLDAIGWNIIWYKGSPGYEIPLKKLAAMCIVKGFLENTISESNVRSFYYNILSPDIQKSIEEKVQKLTRRHLQYAAKRSALAAFTTMAHDDDM